MRCGKLLSLVEKDFMYSDGVTVSSRKICVMKKWYGKLVALYYNYDVRYFYMNGEYGSYVDDSYSLTLDMIKQFDYVCVYRSGKIVGVRECKSKFIKRIRRGKKWWMVARAYLAVPSFHLERGEIDTWSDCESGLCGAEVMGGDRR